MWVQVEFDVRVDKTYHNYIPIEIFFDLCSLIYYTHPFLFLFWKFGCVGNGIVMELTFQSLVLELPPIKQVSLLAELLDDLRKLEGNIVL